ncbi:hypothetical protein WJX84_009026 [Apatococcus fuscideae]|uniref:Uncharacterized protein n=1 Tax=Apatococcus fuscideae TaxID=2026836 RepID=A0AAW1T473_9CHLO
MGASIGSCGYGAIPLNSYPYWSIGALSMSNLFFQEGPVEGCGWRLWPKDALLCSINESLARPSSPSPYANRGSGGWLRLWVMNTAGTAGVTGVSIRSTGTSGPWIPMNDNFGTAPNKFGQDPSGAFIGQLAAAAVGQNPPVAAQSTSTAVSG